MRKWSFKVKNTPKEVSCKLKLILGAERGFVFNYNQDTNDAVLLNIRKRIQYIWYMHYHNWTTIKGRLVKTDAENNTRVELSFKQHWFILLMIVTQLLLGLGILIPIVFGISSSISLYLSGGIILTIGVILWIDTKKKFEKDIKKFKALISDVLEL